MRPEPIHGIVEELPGADWLSFAEIATPLFKVYPVATQIAEKLHALTAQRNRPNTRVKDLPDILLLASLVTPVALDTATIITAIESTFAHRSTPVPTRFPEMPPEWRLTYERIVKASLLPWRSFATAVGQVGQFIDPILSRTAKGSWSPSSWHWR